MKAPKRKRPLARVFMSPKLDEEALKELAEKVHYHGSPEHKRHPSFAGPPAPRATASLCDPSFANKQDLLTAWLREAVANGQIGQVWDDDFPRNVWLKKSGIFYEARLVNRGNGGYKGWPLEEFEAPEELK